LWIDGDWWGFTVSSYLLKKINGNPHGYADLQIVYSIGLTGIGVDSMYPSHLL